MYTLSSFYRSKRWAAFRDYLIDKRTNKADGFVYDEVTGKPIVKAYDIILHHTIVLTESNVNDFDISLNEDLIQIVSHATHNMIQSVLDQKDAACVSGVRRTRSRKERVCARHRRAS